MAATKVRLTVTINTELVRRVDAAAAKLHQSRSAFMESLIRSSLVEADGVASVMSNPKLLNAFYAAFAVPGVLESFTTAFQNKLTREETQPVRAFMSTGAPKSPKRRKP